MTRIAVRFSRMGMSKYISHLDMQRTFSRALRRTGLSVKTSSGFNPHIVLSFASAMSVGMESRSEYMEFTLLQEMKADIVRDKLNACLPVDIRVFACYPLKEGTGKLMAMVNAAKVEFLPEEGQQECFKNAALTFLRQASYFIEKRGKKESKRIDIMPLIYGAEIGDRIFFTLAHSNEASLNPFLLIKEISALAGREFSVAVVREELLASGERPLFEMF